jgi:hypothetical protein
MPKHDIPDVNGGKATGRYVTIPELDLFGMPHPGVRLNVEAFNAGTTHFLDKERADTVEAALNGYEETSRRVLQPRQDTKALRDVERGSGRGLERVATP